MEDDERGRGKPNASEAEGEERTEWRPPRRDHGLPDAGVVTLEEQPDEERAFGPAAPLVSEWRGIRTGAGDSSGRVDWANAAVRWWELEIALLEGFRLTLPPESEPLDPSRRDDHLRWRKEALAAARRDLAKARWLRRALTLGL